MIKKRLTFIYYQLNTLKKINIVSSKLSRIVNNKKNKFKYLII